MKKVLFILVLCSTALLMAQETNTWTGAQDLYWNHWQNWSLGRVPLPSDHAVVPAGVPRFPKVTQPHTCGYLTLQSAAMLIILDYSLTVLNSAYITGNLVLQGDGLFKTQNISFFAGSTFTSTSANTLEVQGDLTIFSSAVVDSPVALLFSGSGTSVLRTNSSAVFGALSLAKTTGSLTFSVMSTATVTIDGSVFVSANNAFYHGYGGNTNLAGNLVIDPGGSCLFDYGTLVMTCEGGNYIQDLGGTSHLNNLTIAKGATGSLETTNLDLRGSFTLASGTFYAPPLLAVAGNFTNNAGLEAYYAGTTVSFTGSGVTQEVFGQSGFYNVLDNYSVAGRNLVFNDETWIWGTLTLRNNVSFNASSILNVVDNAPPSAPGTLSFNLDQDYSIQSYVSGGTLNCNYGSNIFIADLAQDSFYGVTNVSGSQLEVHQDSGQTIGLNGTLNISGAGAVTFQGGAGLFILANVSNTSLSMSSGVLFIDRGVRIATTASVCEFDISGGIIDVNGGWLDGRGTFQPTGGRVRFTGGGDNNVATQGASWFWELEVFKWMSRAETPSERFSTLTLGAVIVKGGFLMTEAHQVVLEGGLTTQNAAPINILTGTLRTNGRQIFSSGNLTVSGGSLILEPGSILKMDIGKICLVTGEGVFLALGTAVSPVLVTHYNSGYYHFTVEAGGRVGAVHTNFEFMGVSGIDVRATGFVDEDYPFDNCVFRDGIALSPYSLLLTLDNNQNLFITGVAFPDTYQNSAYNVSKAAGSSGTVYFSGWTGTYGGEGYDQDPGDQVFWEGQSSPPPQNLDATRITDPERIRLDWSHPFSATYTIYGCATPDGPFVPIGSATEPFWLHASPPDRYFYKVSAVMP